jgi:hypothetical protein
MRDFGMQLWESGIRGDVTHHFYEIPLKRFSQFGDELVMAVVVRDGEDGPETCHFVCDKHMLNESVARMPQAVRDAMADSRDDAPPVNFNVTASLTAPMDQVCPFFVEELTPASGSGAATPFTSEDMPLGNEDEEDEEDEEKPWDENYFPIAVEYKLIIERLVASCDLLLRRPNLEPREISYLGKLKYALSRLPLTTDGTDFDAFLKETVDDKGSSNAVSLHLDRGRFALSLEAYYYGPCGGDSEGRCVYDCESTGYRGDLDRYSSIVVDELQEWISRWEAYSADPDAELSISEIFDDFDWDQQEDESAWEGMPHIYV